MKLLSESMKLASLLAVIGMQIAPAHAQQIFPKHIPYKNRLLVDEDQELCAAFSSLPSVVESEDGPRFNSLEERMESVLTLVEMSSLRDLDDGVQDPYSSNFNFTGAAGVLILDRPEAYAVFSFASLAGYLRGVFGFLIVVKERAEAEELMELYREGAFHDSKVHFLPKKFRSHREFFRGIIEDPRQLWEDAEGRLYVSHYERGKTGLYSLNDQSEFERICQYEVPNLQIRETRIQNVLADALDPPLTSDTLHSAQGLYDDLRAMIGEVCDTATDNKIKAINITLLNALIRPWMLDYPNERRLWSSSQVNADQMEVRLKKWSYTGLWSFKKYTSFLANREKLRSALIEDYQRVFGFDEKEAKELAAYNVNRVSASAFYFLDGYGKKSDIWDNLDHYEEHIQNLFDHFANSAEPLEWKAVEHNPLTLLNMAVLEGQSKQVIDNIINAYDLLESPEYFLGRPSNALLAAVDRPQTLSLLLELGVPVGQKNGFGKTALMAAAQHGNMESVRILLDAGADVKIKTSSESPCIANRRYFGQPTLIVRDALRYAEESGHDAIAELLKNAMASIE